jgi:hypothetical protein
MAKRYLITACLTVSGVTFAYTLARFITSLTGQSSSRASSATADPPTASPPLHPEPAPSDGASPGRGLLYALIVLVFATGSAMIAFWCYHGLRHWHPAVSLDASTSNSEGSQSVSLASASGSPLMVHWHLDAAYIKQLTVTTGEEIAEVILPLGASKCVMMARKLDGQCTDGRLSITSPASFSWSSQQLASSASYATSSELDLVSSLDRAGTRSITLSSQAGRRPDFCLSAAAGTPATLTIQHGPHRYHSAGQAAIGCSTGLVVLIAAAGSGLSPTFQFDGIGSLLLQASAPTGLLQGFTGQVDLGPGAQTAVGPTSTVSLHTELKEPLDAQLALGPGVSLHVKSSAATSVMVNADELVPSEWARNSAVILPLFGGFVTAFVVAPLGVAVQALMGELKRWQDGVRWAAQRKRKPKGSRNAS